MNKVLKQRIAKILLYMLVGFGIAFLWHKMKT